jgi:hypothetical protein
MSRHNPFLFSVDVVVSPLLPFDDDEFTGEYDEDGNPIYRLTGKKIHYLVLKNEGKVLVSQEYHEQLVKHYSTPPQ